MLSAAGAFTLSQNEKTRKILYDLTDLLSPNLRKGLKDNPAIQWIESGFTVNPIYNYMASFGSQHDPLAIHINFSNYQKLLAKRNEALQNGLLVKGSDDFVNAALIYKNKNYKAKVRLKGDWTDHLVGDKWSLRVELKITPLYLE